MKNKPLVDWGSATLREAAWAPLSIFGFYMLGRGFQLFGKFPYLDIPVHFKRPSLMARKDSAGDRKRLKNRLFTIVAKRKFMQTRISSSPLPKRNGSPTSARPIQERLTTRAWQTRKIFLIQGRSFYTRMPAFKDMNRTFVNCINRKKASQERVDDQRKEAQSKDRPGSC